jgi:hypothetical protein
MDIRRSPATSKNALIQHDTTPPGQGNARWLSRQATAGSVILVGGASLSDFRLRVAQSHLRTDMLPSFWSAAGIATGGRVLMVPLLPIGDPSAVPGTNAVTDLTFAEFDNEAQYPNVATIQFADRSEAIVANVRRIMSQRHAIDIPSMVLSWLAFVWGAGARRNPLLDNVGIPSAALVQTAFGMSGIELTPGLASGSSCPEVIWQSALWWHDYYEKTASVDPRKMATARTESAQLPRSIVPMGAYRIQQPAAAVTYEPKPPAAAGAATPAPAPKAPVRRRRSRKRT